MTNEEILGSYLHPDEVDASKATSISSHLLRDTKFFRGVDHSTQEGIPFWSQGTRFSLLTGKCLSNRVTCEWSETGKLKWEWIDDIENLHIQSLPDSKAMSYGSLRWEGYVCTDPLMITSWSTGCYSSVVREKVRNLQMSYLSLRIYNYYII